MTKETKQAAKSAKKTSIGGQALLEGIMMRGPKKTAMAVRHVSGNIVVEEYDTDAKAKKAFWRLPFFRGWYGMVTSMVTGYKCLMRSAELSGIEEEDNDKKMPEKAEDATEIEIIGTNDRSEQAPAEKAEEAAPAMAEGGSKVVSGDEVEPLFSRATSMLLTVGAVVLGLALSVLLFMYLPEWLYKLLCGAFPSWENNVFLRGVFVGVVKILIFIVYLLLVTMMKDIRRTFMYHGAEHKCIFCYEHDLPLTVENVRKQSRFHPRCGTSFMILMLLVGIILSICIPFSDPVWRTVAKLLTLPVVVGVGYELIKLAGRRDNLFTRIISAPGKWMQRITTKEPDDSMIECAIEAFKRVVPDDGSDNW